MTQQPYAPPGYPPQQYAPPAPPQAPQQPYYPPQQPQQYAAPGYPPQQAYAPPAPQQQAPPPVQGTLDDFYNQPSSGGGPSLKFEQVGTRYVGVVSRPIGPGDVQQQTNTQGVPQTFKDGRPKWVMKVPLQMQPSPAYPDGLAQWYVKGAARDELVRAMAEAGAPEGAPQAGAIIDITFTSTRAAGVGMNPAKLFHVVYTKPGDQPGQPPSQPQQAPQGADAPSPAPAPPAPPQQAQQYVQEPAQQQYAPPPPAPPAQQQYAPPPPQQQYAPPPAAQVPQQPPAQPAPPSDLSPEQQQLLARLTGG